jgi:hypothetical protein
MLDENTPAAGTFETGQVTFPTGLSFNLSTLQRLATALTLLVLTATIAAGIWRVHRGKLLFWDAHVYLRALRAYVAGGNPYQNDVLPFIYPPIFLKVAWFMRDIIFNQVFLSIYVVLHCAAVLGIPFLFSKGLLHVRWLGWAAAAAIFLCEPDAAAQKALFSGNISAVDYALVLTASLLGLHRNEWRPFYLLLWLAAIVKPTFIGLLLIPLLLGQGQLFASFVTGGLAVLSIIAQRILWPELFAKFLEALHYQTLNRRGVGVGIFGSSVIHHWGAHIPIVHDSIGIGLHVVLVGALILALLLLRSSVQGSDAIWICLVITVSFMLNPRLEPYDLDITAIPAAVLLVEGCRKLRAHGIPLLAFAVAAVLFALLLYKDYPLAELCLLISACSLGIYSLTRDNQDASEGERGRAVNLSAT